MAARESAAYMGAITHGEREVFTDKRRANFSFGHICAMCVKKFKRTFLLKTSRSKHTSSDKTPVYISVYRIQQAITMLMNRRKFPKHLKQLSLRNEERFTVTVGLNAFVFRNLICWAVSQGSKLTLLRGPNEDL